MEWLRCNKCYDLLVKSDRNFSMTPCGHVFCDCCLTKAASRCYECETFISRSMTLTKPPRLETVMNYFSPATRFAEQTKKAMQFHDEQLIISLRGLEQMEKKYERAKRCYEESQNSVKDERIRYKNKVDLVNKLLASLKVYKTQSIDQRVDVVPSANTSIPFFETPKIYGSRCSNSNRDGNNTPVDPVDSNVERRRNFNGSRSIGAKWKSSLEPSFEHSNRYEPSPGFSNVSRASSSTINSGCATSMTATPMNIRQGEFVVPTIKKVPKSAVLFRRKVPTKALPRLSEPKI